jgi:RNA polymerase sigma factor (sigma-70 family)
MPPGEGTTNAPGRPATASDRHAFDKAFVQRLLARDGAALEHLRVRLACLPAMVRHQNRKLGGPLNESDVEEVVRDTVAALWAKLATFEGRSTLETWVYRFAFLELLKSVQRKCRSPQILEDPWSHPEPTPEESSPYRSDFDRKDLAEGLALLTRGAAEVIRLRHFEEQSFEEIARSLDVPLNTVKARYYRGLARLKEVLERGQRRGKP